MSLPPQGERDKGIIAKEAYSEYAQCPFGDLGAVSFLSNGRNGGDQVEDRCCQGSEEITPGPADELYLGMQAK